MDKTGPVTATQCKIDIDRGIADAPNQLDNWMYRFLAKSLYALAKRSQRHISKKDRRALGRCIKRLRREGVLNG